jgi:hypothetical protein
VETQPLREPPPDPRSRGWTFAHPSHGTCVPECPSYGRCHCGCEAAPKLSAVTSVPWNRHAGHPFTFVPGHQLRVVHPRAGMWSKQGVPVERVRPLIRWLRVQHGSVRAVAELLDMPESTLRGYLYNAKRKRVPPEAAQRIVALTLAHRKRTRPLELWEEIPGRLEQPAIVFDRRPVAVLSPG